MAVEEKCAVVLAQYEVSYTNLYRSRGAYYLETENAGTLVLRVREMKEGRAVYEEGIRQCAINRGFEKVDTCIKNKEGKYVTEGDYGETFLLRRQEAGEECNLKEERHALLAARELARLHLALTDCPVAEEYIQGDIREEFQRRIRELKRIETYLRKRKQKNAFELALQEELPRYRKKAEQVLEQLPEGLCEGLLSEAVARGLICHGNYGSHSLLIQKDAVFVSGFELAKTGIQVVDLYYLLRKAMEKNDWNLELFAAMTEAYERVRPLSEAERSLLQLLFHFPDRFCRVCNQYMNTRKAWIPARNAGKLLLVLDQQKQKEDFEKSGQMKAWFSKKHDRQENEGVL